MKISRVFLILLILAIILTGCVNKEKLSQTMSHPASSNDAASKDVVASSGRSNVVFQVSMNVLPLMLEVTQGLPYDVTAVGTEAAIEGVKKKTCELALVDGLTTDVSGLHQIVGYAGVTFIVNPQSALTDISTEDVCALFLGETSEIKGEKVQIVLTGATEPSRSLLEELFYLKGEVNGMNKSLIPDTAQVVGSDDEVLQTVANNTSYIGVILVGRALPSVKALSLDGVTNDKENLKNGSYYATMPITLLADASHQESFEQFVTLIKGEQGKNTFLKLGFVQE